MNEKKENQTAKISISQSAEAALDQMVRAANDGFLGGRITKHQLASWALSHFSDRYFESTKDVIREDHFDRTVFLAEIAAKMKAASRKGEDTSELERELMRVLGGPASKRVRKKKIQTQGIDK